MEQNYTVQYKLHDSKNNSWANQVVAQYDDYWTAQQKYASEIARLINVLDYDFVAVIFMDTFGRTEVKVRDSRVAPEPEPNEE